MLYSDVLVTHIASYLLRLGEHLVRLIGEVRLSTRDVRQTL